MSGGSPSFGGGASSASSASAADFLSSSFVSSPSTSYASHWLKYSYACLRCRALTGASFFAVAVACSAARADEVLGGGGCRGTAPVPGNSGTSLTSQMSASSLGAAGDTTGAAVFVAGAGFAFGFAGSVTSTTAGCPRMGGRALDACVGFSTALRKLSRDVMSERNESSPMSSAMLRVDRSGALQTREGTDAMEREQANDTRRALPRA